MNTREFEPKAHIHLQRAKQLMGFGLFSKINSESFSKLMHVGVAQGNRDSACGACALALLGVPANIVATIEHNEFVLNDKGMPARTVLDMIKEWEASNGLSAEMQTKVTLFVFNGKVLAHVMREVKRMFGFIENGYGTLVLLSNIFKELDGHYLTAYKSSSGTPYFISTQNIHEDMHETVVEGYKNICNVCSRWTVAALFISGMVFDTSNIGYEHPVDVIKGPYVKSVDVPSRLPSGTPADPHLRRANSFQMVKTVNRALKFGNLS